MLASERVLFIVKCSYSPRIFDTLIIFVHNNNNDNTGEASMDIDISMDINVNIWIWIQMLNFISTATLEMGKRESAAAFLWHFCFL